MVCAVLLNSRVWKLVICVHLDSLKPATQFVFCLLTDFPIPGGSQIVNKILRAVGRQPVFPKNLGLVCEVVQDLLGLAKHLAIHINGHT